MNVLQWYNGIWEYQYHSCILFNCWKKNNWPHVVGASFRQPATLVLARGRNTNCHPLLCASLVTKATAKATAKAACFPIAGRGKLLGRYLQLVLQWQLQLQLLSAIINGQFLPSTAQLPEWLSHVVKPPWSTTKTTLLQKNDGGVAGFQPARLRNFTNICTLSYNEV